MAARPKTLFAAVGPVVAGGGFALADGVFDPLPFAAAFACALLIQVAANFANDYSDFVRGADAEDRVGFTRAAQGGLISPRHLLWAVALVYAVGIAIATYLVAVGGWPVVAIGLAAMVAALAYTGGPWPFGYHGLGDLFVFAFFGPVAVGGTYYVQALLLPRDLLVAGAGVGALVTAILVVNNLRDLRSDARVGKRTLAVILGPGGTRVEYAALLVVAALAPLAGVVGHGWSAGTLLSLAALALAPGALRTVLRHRDARELNAALPRTALMSALYGLLLGVGANL